MHPLLRSLDLSASAGDESSVYGTHPILDSASPRPRGLPLLFSLGLTPLLIYGLGMSLVSPSTLQLADRILDQGTRSISLILHEPTQTPATPGVPPPPEPVLKPVAPERATALPHRDPTDNSDPKPGQASGAQPFSESDLSSRGERADTPVAPIGSRGETARSVSGSGISHDLRGTGYGAKPVKVFDLQLVPTRQVPVNHQLIWGQEATGKEPIRVRIQVGEDGVPFEAVVLSGPSFLHRESIKAALEWRFEPLALHGLKAPISTVLIFYPNFLKPR